MIKTIFCHKEMCQYHAKVAQLKMWLYPKNKNTFLTDLKNCNFDTTWFHFFDKLYQPSSQKFVFFFFLGWPGHLAAIQKLKNQSIEALGIFFSFFPLAFKGGAAIFNWTIYVKLFDFWKNGPQPMKHIVHNEAKTLPHTFNWKKHFFHFLKFTCKYFY